MQPLYISPLHISPTNDDMTAANSVTCTPPTPCLNCDMGWLEISYQNRPPTTLEINFIDYWSSSDDWHTTNISYNPVTQTQLQVTWHDQHFQQVHYHHCLALTVFNRFFSFFLFPFFFHLQGLTAYSMPSPLCPHPPTWLFSSPSIILVLATMHLCPHSPAHFLVITYNRTTAITAITTMQQCQCQCPCPYPLPLPFPWQPWQCVDATMTTLMLMSTQHPQPCPLPLPFSWCNNNDMDTTMMTMTTHWCNNDNDNVDVNMSPCPPFPSMWQ